MNKEYVMHYCTNQSKFGFITIFQKKNNNNNNNNNFDLGIKIVIKKFCKIYND